VKYDKFGQAHCDTDELCGLLYKNPDLDISKFLIDDAEQYNLSVASVFADMPLLVQYKPYSSITTLKDFDIHNQSNWKMPQEYRDFDIAQWVLGKCKNEVELQRVADELILYQERDLFNLLRFLKYFVDTMHKNQILWGVGRGSSVASFVLYLIGVHRINSISYELDITEFLKPDTENTIEEKHV